MNNAGLFRQIVKIHEAVLREVQQVQKKIDQLNRLRQKKIHHVHQLAKDHHHLYKKLETQKQGETTSRKRRTSGER